MSGELTYIDADDCGERTYTAGQAFVDAGHGDVHSAYNPTGAPTVLIATFFEAPTSGSLLLPADPAAHARHETERGDRPDIEVGFGPESS